MSYTSLLFIPFVAVTVLLYYTVFRKCQWLLLLLASIAFYLFAGPKYIVFVLLTGISTYLLALRIQQIHDKEKQIVNNSKKTDRDLKEFKKKIKKSFTHKRKFYLIVDFLINIGILFVIKYTDFFLRGISQILARFGTNWSKEFEFVLPLGISFYTFMSVGYILDVYWKRYNAEKNPLKVLCFLMYFPHILQGPISRFNKLSSQMCIKHKFSYENLTKGLQLALWGVFEKIVIADRLAVFAKGVYSKSNSLTGLPLVIAIIFFSLQLYMDFQGCMDIGRGVSKIFGIDLELNFKRPYFSKTMPEFWRRWHITLGTWFKDYLLYPVSMSKLCKTINKSTRRRFGNQVSRACSSIIPTTCVWLITGLWHGAAMCYVLWGIYHGILIICSSVFEVPIQKINKLLHINTENGTFKLFQMCRSFVLSAIGRIFFVATGGFFAAIEIIKRTFDFEHFNWQMLKDGSLYQFGLDRANFILSWLLILLIWIVGIMQEHFVIRDKLAKQNIVIRWVAYLSLIAGIIIFGMYGSDYNSSAFVYGQF